MTSSSHQQRSIRSLAGSTRRAMRRLGWRVEDWRLEAEQRRGILGPAHRSWRDVADHAHYWSAYDWSRQGNEWNSSPEWKQALIDDVLLHWIPPGVSTLEIGPGAGRWTEVLAPRASHLRLVDVSERPLELCRDRFGEDSAISYILTRNSDLPGVPNSSVDAIWSFDVFVHLAPPDQASYLTEIARVLTPGGVAVIHHADGRNQGHLPSRQGWRSPMSRNLFAVLAREVGLRVASQFDSWGSNGRYNLSDFGDAITVLRAPE